MNIEAPQMRDLVKQLCEAEGSQSRFARRIGASPQKVNNWISGRNEPGAEMLVAISRSYGIPIDDLVNATNLEVPVQIPVDEIDREASEINGYLKRMTDNQRSAVLCVARAMVDC